MRIKRSRFNLSHNHLTTCEMGKLIPFLAIDCLPNDKFFISNLSTHKAQPMIAPLMHQVDIMTQYYFVPYRILWENWVEFITGGETGTSAPTFPTMKAPATTGIQPNTLFDYFGLPINQPEIEFSAMLARAYTKIWNDHYKIEDIEQDLPLSLADGLDIDTNTGLMNAHWARDKFTRAKPFTQRGNQINVPIIAQQTDSEFYEIFEPTLTIGTSTYQQPTSQKLGTIYTSPNIQLYTDTTGGFNYNSYCLLARSDEKAQKINQIILEDIDITAKPSAGYFEVIQTAGVCERIIGDANNTITPTEQTKITGITLNQGANYPSGTLKPNIYLTIQSIAWGTSTTIENTKSPTQITAQDTPTYNFKKYTKDNKAYCFAEIATGTFKIRVSLKARGTNASLNIRDLRIASALQRYQENSLKYGAEYEEYCRQEFGVSPRDSRLQKSEWLGGSQSVLQISEVFQTADSVNTPLGAQAGYGIGSLRQRRIRYKCPEHGVIIGILSYRPVTIYTQGIERAWLKRQRFDYYTREFQNIGAQEILQQEVFATKDNADQIFGYDLAGNYQEYRKATSHISGNFRTDLTFWHLGRIFSQPPALNSSFITMQPRKDIFAITDETMPAFLTYIQNRIIAYRPMPKKVKNILR